MRPGATLAIPLIAMAIGACVVFTTEDRDWSFMQSVGGVSIGQPHRAKGKVYLPVQCDVSGLTTITVKPSSINSGLVVRDIRASRDGATVYVWVRTSLPHKKDGQPCGTAELGDLPQGKYTVFYGKPPRWFRKAAQQPVKIGEIEVEP